MEQLLAILKCHKLQLWAIITHLNHIQSKIIVYLAL